MNIDENRQLSNFVPDRLPEFVRVDHPTLVSFLSAYYEWLGIRRDSGLLLSPMDLGSVADIDTTLDQFVNRFKSEYLLNFPESLAINPETNFPVDPKRLVKNIKQFYLAKGTEKSYEFLFRILYDTAVEFYYPKVDVLRLSSGRWTQNNYIRVSNTLGDSIYRVAGNNVIQTDSNGSIVATAKVISVNTFQIGNFPVAELEITGRNGTFRVGNLGIDFEDGGEKFHETRVYGVVSSVTINSGGTDYQIGDRVRFIPQDAGQQAIGTVTEVDSVGGIRKISVDDFGINYEIPDIEIQIESVKGSGFSGEAVVGSLCQSAGYYSNNDGRLSTNKVLQDNHYFQNWSYVLKSEIVIDRYREVIRRLVHPVGTAMFGSVLIKRCAEADLDNASALMSYEVPLIGHYAPYTFNTFDDLSLWFDQGISNYEKADAIYQGLLTQFNSCFGETSGSTGWEGCKQFDYNFDGYINGDDLGLFLTRWGNGPEAPGYSPQLHNIYIQGIGSGYAISGNPITNEIEFVGATSYVEVLKTEDFPGADPFWIIYTHPNKKVERGYHIAKIWKTQVDDFLNGDNNAPWHEWQYIREQRSQEQIDEWNIFGYPLRLASGFNCELCLASNNGGGNPCPCAEDCNEPCCACPVCVCDETHGSFARGCRMENCATNPSPLLTPCKRLDCAIDAVCPEACYEESCKGASIYRAACYYNTCAIMASTFNIYCTTDDLIECMRRQYCRNYNEIGGHPCECGGFEGPPGWQTYLPELAQVIYEFYGRACGDCNDATCCACQGMPGYQVGGKCEEGCKCDEDCPNFDPCTASCPNNTPQCNQDCPEYDPCATDCPIPPDPCNQTCPDFDWCNCDPTGLTCCTANPCAGQCFNPCETDCPGYGPCHPTCPTFDPDSLCDEESECYQPCVCADPCNQTCPDFDWCNCDATGATCCAANPCSEGCLEPCESDCPGYGVCHPDCEQYDPCLCEGPCDPTCPGNECNTSCPQYVSCNENCPDYDPVACCEGCNCGNGGGVGEPIYRDPPLTTTGGFPIYDPNENNPCLGVRTPHGCELGRMQSNPYDFKYALLEYDENSEFRKITARAFFNMPEGQEFDCKDESFGNVPVPMVRITNPIFGAVVNNPKVPDGLSPSEYDYYRTYTVTFDIENSESLPYYRAVEIRVYHNNRLVGTLPINGRRVSLKAVRDGRHTIRVEIYDKTGKLIPGSQAISIFGYEFVPPRQRPAIFDEISVETPIFVDGTPFSIAGVLIAKGKGSEILNTIKELIGNGTINVPVTVASTSTDGPFIARNTPDDPILTGTEYIEIEGSDPTTPVSPPECGCVPFTRDSCCCKSLLLPPDFFRPEIIPYRPAPPFNPKWTPETVPCGWHKAAYLCECSMTITVVKNCNGVEETKEEFVPLHQEFRSIQPPGWDTLGDDPFQICPDEWVREYGDKPCYEERPDGSGWDSRVPWWGIPTRSVVAAKQSIKRKECRCTDPSTGCSTVYVYEMFCSETIAIDFTPGCNLTPGNPIITVSPESPSPLFINASDIR
jgi:hypothetical protein